MISEQHIRMVTHHGDLVLFQCKHFLSKGSEITSWRMSFNQLLDIFLKKDDNITLIYKTSRKADMVHCNTAINAKTKQAVPCVLLRLCKKGSRGFRYMLFSLNSNNSANLHVEISLPYEMADISILHGPILVWTHKDSALYISSGAPGDVKEIHMKINFIGAVPLCQRPLGIIGSQMVPQQDRFKIEGKCRSLLYLIEDGRTFSGHCFFPEPYSSVLQCLVVLSAMEVDGSLRTSIVAATSRKQLVYFENGLPDKVCSLPYEEPRRIHIAKGGTGCLIIIIFEHGNACAVENNSFKVVSCWTGVHHLFMDDFVGGGFEQLLLVFEEACLTDEVFGKFLLTDLCGIHYSLGTEGHETLNGCEMSAEENVILMIQALNSRLQNGLLFLQDLQLDLLVKGRVIQQCVSALHDHIANRKHLVSPAQQEELVCLLDEQSKEDECTPDDRIIAHSEEQFSKVEKVWYTVIGKNLVFGVLLTSNNQITEWENLSAAVLALSSVTESQATILYYPVPVNSTMSGHPSAKRNKLPTGQAVLTVTDLASLLSFYPITCSILICFPCNKTGSASQHIELVNLDLKRVLEERLQPHLFEVSGIDYDESTEDLLSLMGTFKSWYFRIRSTDHTVVDVARILEEKFAAERIKANPQYLMSHSTQPSGAKLYHWKVCGFFEGLLEFYCSDHHGLLCFLDSLCSFLPSSHHIQLLKNERAYQQNPTLFMEHEILRIKEAMAGLVCVGSEESVEKVKHVTDFQVSRELWQRERSGSRLHPLVEVQLYRQAVERVVDITMNSDDVALLEAQLSES